MAHWVLGHCATRAITQLRKTERPARSTACRKLPRRSTRRSTSWRWTGSPQGWSVSSIRDPTNHPRKTMNERRETLSDTNTTSERYACMVLLVDDQVLIGEAVRRALLRQL